MSDFERELREARDSAGESLYAMELRRQQEQKEYSEMIQAENEEKLRKLQEDLAPIKPDVVSMLTTLGKVTWGESPFGLIEDEEVVSGQPRIEWKIGRTIFYYQKSRLFGGRSFEERVVPFGQNRNLPKGVDDYSSHLDFFQIRYTVLAKGNVFMARTKIGRELESTDGGSLSDLGELLKKVRKSSFGSRDMNPRFG